MLAWHELARAIDREGRPFDALGRVLDETYGGKPTCAMSVALWQTVNRYQFSALSFRRAVDERSRFRETGTFETRDALLRHVRRLVHAETKMMLRVLGRDSERDEKLAFALAEGLQLAAWIVSSKRELARGHLYLAVDDLAEHGVDLLSLQSGESNERLRAVVERQVNWSRELLSKGWPLCRELGPWRGRELAWFLRWHAASLSAVEARGYDVARGTPPAGWLRVLACTAAVAPSCDSPWRRD